MFSAVNQALQHLQEAILPLHTSQALHPLKEEDITPPAPLFTAIAFIFDCESAHLDRRYFNRCKDMQKMYLAHKTTCSHVEGMFSQLTFQPDFLGQFLEQLNPPPHTHPHTHMYMHIFTPTSPLSAQTAYFHIQGSDMFAHKGHIVALLSDYFLVLPTSVSGAKG